MLSTVVTAMSREANSTSLPDSLHMTLSWVMAGMADMMKNTTWMDANEAFQLGFVDGIMTNPSSGIENAAFIRTANLEEAKAKYAEWHDRHRPIVRSNAEFQNRAEPPEEPAIEPIIPEDIELEGVPVELLLRQLDAIRYW